MRAFGVFFVFLALFCVSASALSLGNLPDLTIQGVLVQHCEIVDDSNDVVPVCDEIDNVFENDFFNVTIIVANNSLVDANAFSVVAKSRLFPDGKKTFSVPSLEAGESTELAVENVFSKAGKYPLQVSVDSKNKVKESNENNNVFNGKIKILKKDKSLLPDFKIKRIFTAEDANGLIKTKLFSLRIEVENDSNNSFLGPIYVSVGSQIFGKEKKTFLIDGLAAGETKTLELNELASNASSIVIEARVDPSNKIAESNEKNNLAKQKIEFGKKILLLPNLKINSIATTTSEERQRVPVAVSIKNDSNNATDKNFLVELLIEEPGQLLILEVKQPIQPNETITVTFENILFSYGKITATVDSGNAVKEQNEKDNSKTTIFEEPPVPPVIVCGCSDLTADGKIDAMDLAQEIEYQLAQNMLGDIFPDNVLNGKDYDCIINTLNTTTTCATQ